MARLVEAVIWPSAAPHCAPSKVSINLQLDRPSTRLSIINLSLHRIDAGRRMQIFMNMQASERVSEN